MRLIGESRVARDLDQRALPVNLLPGECVTAHEQRAVGTGLLPQEFDHATNFSLTLTATFQPDCSPPMEVAFTDVQVCDTTNNICRAFSDTF